MGVHEVTQGQYEKAMGVNPSSNKGADNPVENVTWADAVIYCRRSIQLPAEKAAGNRYCLPTRRSGSMRAVLERKRSTGLERTTRGYMITLGSTRTLALRHIP